MPIDGLGSISNEQLMAMSLMSNGQLTNDSTSSEASEYNNLAFQMMMQNYMDSAKDTTKNNVNTIINNSNITNSTDGSNVVSSLGNSENNENNGENTEAATEAINAAAVSNQTSRAVQTYLAGQKLTDIPLVLNGYSQSVYQSGNSGSILDNRTPEDLSKIYSAVREASQKYGVNESLILAIIKQESDFDSTCVSSAGASGLMQIMPSNYSHLGISDPFDVNQNINGGTKLLKEYLNQYNGNIEMALMAYNGGPGTMQNRGVKSSSDLYKMPKETQNYVPKVMGYYENGI